MTQTQNPARSPDEDITDAALEAELDETARNIDAVLEFYSRAEQNISTSQRTLERISGWMGQPVFLGLTLAFVLLWVLINVALDLAGKAPFDAPPYHWLQGLTALCALLATSIVLTKQDRLAKLADQRAHLDLKLMLLTEKKAAKLIDLLEELRRDLPNVKDRHDGEASSLKQAMNPDTVLATLEALAPAATPEAAPAPPA